MPANDDFIQKWSDTASQLQQSVYKDADVRLILPPSTWIEWKRHFAQTTSLAGKVALLKMTYDIGDGYYPERLPFLLYIADLPTLRKQVSDRPLPTNWSTQFTAHNALTKDQCLSVLANEAFAVLCELVFKVNEEDRHDMQRINGMFNNLETVMSFCWFFRTVWLDLPRIGNLVFRSPLPADQEKTVDNFLRQLTSVPVDSGMSQGVRSFAADNPGCFLDILYHTGRLFDLVDNRPPMTVDEKVEEYLRQMALSFPVWRRSGPGQHDFEQIKPLSMAEALAGASPPALVLKVLAERKQRALF